MQHKSDLSFWLLTFVAILQVGSYASVKISLPSRCRTEGRVTLSYKQNGQTILHHLAFTESIDTNHLRSAISIGYVAHQPAKYHARAGSPVIAVDSNGFCSALVGSMDLIPELSWFIDHLMPNSDVADFIGDLPHLVGPSGMLAILEKLNRGEEETKWELEGTVTYRNVPCHVYTKTIRVPGHDYRLKFEIYHDVRLEKDDSNSLYFTMKATTFHEDTSKKDRLIEDTSFTVDFYHIDSVDDDAHRFEEMRDEFNLPLGRACSEFLTPVDIPDSLSQLTNTFSMHFVRLYAQDYILLAYDHRANFLRRSTNDKQSAAVWDINEGIMYYSDPSYVHVEASHDFTSCSMVKIAGDNLGPALKPYNRAGDSLAVLDMIGASKIVFMGKGTVRDMPCRIYETILSEAPYIFGLSGIIENEKADPSDERKPPKSYDYIVQFSVLDNTVESKNKEEAEHRKLPSDQFWPARIVLYKRFKENGAIDKVEQLDVFDFHWSLFGWDTKAVEMFMMPDCFDDEEEQVRLNIMLTFDKIHGPTSKPEDKLLLVFNKFRLEYELLQQVLNMFEIRQAHVIEFGLKLRQNHVNLNLVVADRRKANSLVFQAEGKLPDSYQKDAIVSVGVSEELCVQRGSLIDEISLVMYCEKGFTKGGESLCSAVYGISEPSIENQPEGSSGPKCRVYRFYSYGGMTKPTGNMQAKAPQLYDFDFTFEANLPDGSNGTKKLSAKVVDYEISHELSLLVFNHYAFYIPEESDENSPLKVKTFKSIPLESEADCARLCNLDVTCKSYSFCSSSGNIDNNSNNEVGQLGSCALSNVDIRASNLQEQLVHLKVPVREGEIVSVKGDEKGNEYKLKFNDQCNIYERNQLNMFRQTQEIIWLHRSLTKTFEPIPSTFECAKKSVRLEQSAPDRHVAMFAYCAATSTCLLDETLFESAEVANGTNSATLKQGDHEVLCRVYRKKYQTYFKVSAEVLKQEKPDQQVELKFESVEECARACWIKFGHICASFDYAPGRCLINQVSLNSNEAQWESRRNFLHYERDLKLDELRREHLIGKHKLLLSDNSGVSSFWVKIWSFSRNLLTYVMIGVAFIYGLALGRKINHKLESVTILRQSISAGTGMRARQLTEFSRFTDDELYGDTDAIRLDDIVSSSK